MSFEITHVDIVIRQHHPVDVTLRTALPGTCVDEKHLGLHFKHNNKTDATEYVKEHFPGVPITVIDTINQRLVEIDAEGYEGIRSL